MSEQVLQALANKVGNRHRTATQFVADVLREAIATGELPEGDQLLQNDIAMALGISRTPVRESLRLLEAEGWIEFSPHRGAVVATLSSDEVRQIFEIRFTLEALALKQSLPKIAVSGFDAAARILDELDGEQEISRWVALNRRFHLTLYAGAGERLIRLIESQYDAVDRYLRLELVEMNNADDSQDEHRAILVACRARDVEAAIALSEPHIAGAGVDLAEALAQRRSRA